MHFVSLFFVLSACSSPDLPKESSFGYHESVEYGPTPAMQASCTIPFNNVSDGCGYVWAYDFEGNHLDLAFEQINGEADPNGSPRIEVGDHIWFHNNGAEFTAFWPANYTFSYSFFGQEVWIDPVDCAEELEDGDNFLYPEEMNCVHLFPY